MNKIKLFGLFLCLPFLASCQPTSASSAKPTGTAVPVSLTNYQDYFVVEGDYEFHTSAREGFDARIWVKVENYSSLKILSAFASCDVSFVLAITSGGTSLASKMLRLTERKNAYVDVSYFATAAKTQALIPTISLTATAVNGTVYLPN